MTAVLENENQRRPQVDRPYVEGTIPVANIEQQEDQLTPVGRAEKGVREHVVAERSRTVPPEELATKRIVVSADVKQATIHVVQKAEAVRENLKLSQQVHPDLQKDAEAVSRSVNVFLHAVEHDLVVPPQHEPSRKLFDAFVEKLTLSGEPSIRNSSYFQVLINGLLNEPSYVQFSNDPSAQTKFEKDLVEVLSNQYLYNFMKDVIRMTYAQGENAIPGMSNIQAQQRIDALRELGLGNIRATVEQLKKENRDSIGRQEFEYLETELSKDVDSIDGREALELFHELENKARFYEYYKRKFNEKLRANLSDPNQRGISIEKARERAAKETTEMINKSLMYMMYQKIYAPILRDQEEKSFQERIQSSQKLYGVNPNMLFNWLKIRITKINASIDQSLEEDEEGELPFYQYGNEEVESYVQVNDSNDGYVKKGKLVRETTISSELKKCEGGFYEFVENMHLAMDTENDLLMGGINFNHLMLTGKLEQGQQTFFRQAAAYAHEYLPSSRIDELYKLPYNEVVESAKISISNYYKKRFSYADWIRDPKLVQGIFRTEDPIHHEALKDMIGYYRSRNPPVPDWVIRRAFIHARTHLSLLNLEMHALASYAHAPVDMLMNETYRDPAFKNLETFKTWYAHEQWRVSDTSLKDMAFLPSPSSPRRYERWRNQDVIAEGKEIYKDSAEMGKLSRIDREYYDWDTAPNIMELNPMKFGGVEIQLGFRLKYPMLPWLGDLVDKVVDDEKLHMKKVTDITEGWKRMENIGVSVLKVYRDNFLFGAGGKHIDFGKDGAIKYEEHLKDFFSFLYRRYFSQGVGKDSLSIEVTDKKYNKKTINYRDISSQAEFYKNVVEPILKAEILQGHGETQKDAVERNRLDRLSQLKGIVNQALAVAAFERMPLDFVWIEDPSRSQNGVTLIRELKNMFIPSQDKSETTKEFHDFDNAMDDIAYVQQYAREESIKQMNSFVRDQNDDGSGQKNLYSQSSDTLNSGSQDKSDIQLASGKKGYIIDRDVVREALEKRYGAGNPRVELAVRVYEQIVQRITLKPGKNKQEVAPEVSDTLLKYQMRLRGLNYDNATQKEKFKKDYAEELKKKYAEARENNMETRLTWSKEELLSGETVFSLNDTAYQFLEFIRAGRDMPQRTINAIAVTQEKYKSWVTDVDGALLSALKKYYRKEDLEELHKGIVEMRNRIKEEDTTLADVMAFRVLLNAINVMRINDDAENPLIESQYNALHEKAAAFDGVVHEGNRYRLRRGERYKIVEEFLHSAQFQKRVKGANRVYETKKSWTFEEVLGNLGGFGQEVGRAADMFFGKKAGTVVRKKFEEISGEGMRSRELAGIMDLVANKETPIALLLIAVAFFILFTIQGYKASEE